MKKQIIAAVGVLAIGTTLAIATPNHGGQHRGAKGGQTQAEKLDLSEAHNTQIESIRKGSREENKAFFESTRATREQMREARKANDTAKLESLKAKAEADRATMKQLHQAERQRIAAILTPEQKAKF